MSLAWRNLNCLDRIPLNTFELWRWFWTSPSGSVSSPYLTDVLLSEWAQIHTGTLQTLIVIVPRNFEGQLYIIKDDFRMGYWKCLHTFGHIMLEVTVCLYCRNVCWCCISISIAVICLHTCTECVSGLFIFLDFLFIPWFLNSHGLMVCACLRFSWSLLKSRRMKKRKWALSAPPSSGSGFVRTAQHPSITLTALCTSCELLQLSLCLSFPLCLPLLLYVCHSPHSR